MVQDEPKIQPSTPADEQLIGMKCLRVLDRHRKRLRERSAHPNRVLHFDDLLTLLLMGFFNPTLRSLRTLEDASQGPLFKGVLDVERACRSTLSDANACLDPKLLEPLMRDLRSRLPQLGKTDAQLQELLRRVTIVDGSFFSVAADVEWALRKRKRGSARVDDRFARLDLRLCGVTGLPEGLEITGKGAGESKVAQKHIEPGMIYLGDRGFFSHDYVRKINQKQADCLLRIKSNVIFEAQQERKLTGEHKACGVLSDRLGRLGGCPNNNPPDVELREVVIFDPRHPDKPVRLLTTLLDVEPQVLGEMYRHRWQIELFFRWLKVHANFRHVISYSKNGLTLTFYVAVIGILLMYLHMGRKPSKYAYSLLCMVAAGAATLDDIVPILQERERERELDRQRLARKRAAKTKVP